jgi:LysR family transcriptional regulator, glycine cleavage system transcriptional activator
MSRRLPSLTALRAFEAAARHASFTKAADELAVTQGAVSHQVKALEAELGVKLFHRLHQGLALTPTGQAYLPVVREAFDRLAAGTSQLVKRERTGLLTVSMSPNFAQKWMLHRVGTFAAAHPDIELRISPSIPRVDFARDDVDMAIRHGDGRWPDLNVARLCAEALFPVCMPTVRDGPPALKSPGDLSRVPLLRDQGWEDWPLWLEAAGVPQIEAKGPAYDYKSMAIDAACQGQGVAMARTALAVADLLSGRLVRPFDIALPAPYAYFIVTPKTTAQRPKVVAFRAWLLAEAARDAEALAALESG